MCQKEKILKWTQSVVMLISFSNKMYAADKNAGAKDANPLFSTSFIIIPVISILGRIHPINYAQGKSSGVVATLVILDLNMLSYRAGSSNPTSGTFFSTSM